MKILNGIIIGALLIMISIIGIGVINWIVFLNIIEHPLPESEEKLPDIIMQE